MWLIHSEQTDPSWNLALEEHLVHVLPAKTHCLYLWQNDNTIVVGKNQNTMAQIDLDFVRKRQIRVRRRLSGGGAVYHDLGNLNYTWIADAVPQQTIDYRPFCQPLLDTLCDYGVEATLTGRNDILAGGKKISGNSQYFSSGKVIHHGTILFASDLTILSQALRVDKRKFQDKGIDSVQSRVTNLSSLLPPDVTLATFTKQLIAHATESNNCRSITLKQEDFQQIHQLRQRYDSWEWNFGASPIFSRYESLCIPGCGLVEIHCQVESGCIFQLHFSGDFFGKQDISLLAQQLEGCLGTKQALTQRLDGVCVADYIHGMQPEALIDLLAME